MPRIYTRCKKIMQRTLYLEQKLYLVQKLVRIGTEFYSAKKAWSPVRMKKMSFF